MKTFRQGMTNSAQSWAFCTRLALIVCALYSGAFGELGGDVTSVQVDQARMKGTLHSTQAGAYTVHEIKVEAGTIVREYVSTTGKVFGVVWQGPFVPDMSQLLGTYFEQYSKEAEIQRRKGVGRRPLSIQQPGLVVQTGGHVRSYFGRAYFLRCCPKESLQMRYVKGQNVRSGVLALAVLGILGLTACGGGSSSSSSSSSSTGTTSGSMFRNAGDRSKWRPLGQFRFYPNGAFTSVTICTPGTSTCQTIDGILVDTGSSGLRILASAITLSLPQLTLSGAAVNDCIAFIDGSFLWGPVAEADVKMANEVGSSVPIHVIQNPTAYSIPASCSNGGTNEDTLAALGANGILGVGPEPYDCGTACDLHGGLSAPPVPAYYECPSGGTCQPTFVSLAQQTTDPVVLFTTDNNGVVLQFPAASGQEASLSGSLIFGIGTQTNNQLPSSATLFRLDQFDNFTTTFNGQALTSSFIDSGSNGLFFPDSAIAVCGGNASFYCPPSSLSLSAINQGTNGKTSSVNFSVGNADSMSGSDAVLPTLAGPNTGGFDWGLPFFYGRTVYTAIDGQSTPSGVGPYWAY